MEDKRIKQLLSLVYSKEQCTFQHSKFNINSFWNRIPLTIRRYLTDKYNIAYLPRSYECRELMSFHVDVSKWYSEYRFLIIEYFKYWVQSVNCTFGVLKEFYSRFLILVMKSRFTAFLNILSILLLTLFHVYLVAQKNILRKWK